MVDRYQKLAEAIGSVGGVPVTSDDVRAEMRRGTYNTNIGQDGLLPAMEMGRLKRNVRHAVATRLVDEAFAAKAQRTGAKPAMARANPEWFRSQRQDEMIDQALRTKRHMVPMALAKLLDPTHQTTQKELAWQEFHRGPMWAR